MEKAFDLTHGSGHVSPPDSRLRTRLLYSLFSEYSAFPFPQKVLIRANIGKEHSLQNETEIPSQRMKRRFH